MIIFLSIFIVVGYKQIKHLFSIDLIVTKLNSQVDERVLLGTIWARIKINLLFGVYEHHRVIKTLCKPVQQALNHLTRVHG